MNTRRTTTTTTQVQKTNDASQNPHQTTKAPANTNNENKDG
jgi:hypothetical protein